jgi:hypothetical protein
LTCEVVCVLDIVLRFYAYVVVVITISIQRKFRIFIGLCKIFEIVCTEILEKFILVIYDPLVYI